MLVLAICLAAGELLSAGSRSQNLSTSVTVNQLLKLAFSSNSLSFPDSHPDSVPSIPASGGPLTVTAKSLVGPAAAVTLTVIASNDLQSGLDVIAISNLAWTATGTGFVGGTMSKTVAQSVGSWTGSGSRTGTQSYTLVNSWSYAPGTYTTTLTYTLSTP